MTELTMLWLPILLSSIFVFVVSSLIHMASPWHKNDFPRLEKEDELRTALRPLAIPPGDYMIPRPATRQDMRTPEFAEKMKNGPIIVMTVLPNGPMSMGKSLAGWFVYLIVVGLFSGYITGRALPPGADYLQVFRFVGATAFIGYALALWQMSIWYGRAWTTTIKNSIDGLIYALLTAGTFGWLWPQ
jgi:hypothetical protein